MKEVFAFKLKRLAQLTVIATFLLMIGVLTGCGLLTETNHINHSSNQLEQGQTQANAPQETAGEDALTSFEEVAAYIREHDKLPSNFITKNEAKKLGWIASEGNLDEVAPGKSIGGDRFGNREGLLPNKDGRVWYEADINYKGGHRNADRIVFSNDGLIYMTTDHYKSFTDITN